MADGPCSVGWLHQSGIAAAGLMAAFPVDSSRVLLIDIEGAITPVVADFVTDAVEQVGSGGYQALVVTIDTPGGLDLHERDRAGPAQLDHTDRRLCESRRRPGRLGEHFYHYGRSHNGDVTRKFDRGGHSSRPSRWRDNRQDHQR
ncbi:MAG: hypothetical protein ABR609_01290 [Acidimicrobiia bacterium]